MSLVWPAVSLLEGGMLALILASAALIGGVSGFGFPAIGAISLTFLPATVVVPLLMVLSVVNQLLSLSKDIKAKPLNQWWPDGPTPYLIGGVLGVPIGLFILMVLPNSVMMVILGGLLVTYSFYFNTVGKSLRIGGECGWRGTIVAGFTGGIIGGFSAFPSAAVVVWTSLKGLSKGDVRGVLQPYILIMQALSLVLLAWRTPAVFNGEFWTLLAAMLPIVIPCTLVGMTIYQKLSEVNFKRVGLIVLGVVGASIFAKGAMAVFVQ